MSEPNNEPQTVTLRVKYEKSEASFASQAMVQATQEEIFIDFASGVISDGAEGRIMPIHTRIAMTRPGALRLLQALARTLHGNEGEAGKEARPQNR